MKNLLIYLTFPALLMGIILVKPVKRYTAKVYEHKSLPLKITGVGIIKNIDEYKCSSGWGRY